MELLGHADSDVEEVQTNTRSMEQVDVFTAGSKGRDAFSKVADEVLGSWYQRSGALDVVAGATGMIFVALTIGYLPTIYSEVKARGETCCCFGMRLDPATES